jgi:dCMP deaminase
MHGRKRLDWINTAINLAFDVAQYRSEDPYVQVGAVGIKTDKSLVLGYNGAPAGIEIDWSNRNARRPYVLHAEENVLNLIKPGEIDILAVTHLPCDRCIKLIAQKKIKTVYYSKTLPNYNSELTIKMAKRFKIKLVQICPPLKKSLLRTVLVKKQNCMVRLKKLWKTLATAFQFLYRLRLL